jgi:hypothetical protein
MDWVDKDSMVRMSEDTNNTRTRESSDDCVMVSDPSNEEPNGYFYQILEPSTPIEVLDANED